nr:hypothetical protein [Tanacetum cinerariifolium]
MRPFGYPVTILNTFDPLGKFQGKVDEGFLVGYSVCSKAFRVFNSRTFIVQETLHVNFIENKSNVTGSGPAWLFDIDSLSLTMNYHPVIAVNQTNSNTGFQDTEKVEEEGTQTYVLFPMLSNGSTISQNNNKDALVNGKEHDDDIQNAAGPSNDAMPNLEDLSHDADDVGAEADINNLESIISVSPIPTTRIHKDHPTTQIIGDLSSTTQTRSMARAVRDQEEPKRVHQALKDPSWIEAMQEELLQFKMQKVWILVDLPYGKRAIGTKWFYRNKKDERGIVIKNKVRLVAQGNTQEEGIDYEEEGIDYDEVFAPVARIEAIRIFLAFASYMGFIVYQMDVKSAFRYGTIDEEVYVTQQPSFVDPKFPNKVYKVVNVETINNRIYYLGLRLPSISFMRPFGYPVTFLNTLDPLGKFQGKVDEGFLVGYSVCSKAFRVFNSRTFIVQETLHVNFIENKPNVTGSGPAWLFDIDSLSLTMNYHPVIAVNL